MGLSSFLAERKRIKEEKKAEEKKWISIRSTFQVSEEYQKVRINKEEIEFNKILSFEFVENGKIISETTSNTSTFGNSKTKEKSKQHLSPTKAVVGGIVGGGIGAVVGAGMGKTTTKGKTTHNIITTTSSKTEDVEYCTNMAIEIKTNDITNPFFSLILVPSTMKIRKDSGAYKRIKVEGQKIASILDIIINNNTEEKV